MCHTFGSPFNFVDQGAEINWNSTQIFQWSTAVESKSALESITLPNNTGTRFHLFALSISPASSTPVNGTAEPILSFRRVRFSQNWETVNDAQAQVVEVTVANLLPESTVSANSSLISSYSVEVSGPSTTTVTAGVLNRLIPSDEVTVQVLVANNATSGNATAELKDSQGQVVGSSAIWPVTPLRQVWTSDPNDLSLHETPTWV